MPRSLIRIGVVGASGYSGLELLKLLLGHPKVQIVRLFGNSSAGKRIDAVHPSLRNILPLEIQEFSEVSLQGIDLLLFALPSGQAMSVVPQALAAGTRVIDLGGDFRLSDSAIYRQYYAHHHTAPELLTQAVYGLTEWNCEKIQKARLVANPGCYPTSILLPLIPLLKSDVIESSSIAITAYSGTSGAGKSVTEKMMFTEVNESVRAYKVGTHQHIPEIHQYLRVFGGSEVSFSFVPHLLPVSRGIYTTIHAVLNEGTGEEEIAEALHSCYDASRFVRIVSPDLPEMKNVEHTNFCDIGFSVEGNSLILLSTIDNLGKGAA
ncbi:MAG: N-acetyl-gamma-glutamyl-phosphate reductase, partial [Bacteroidetes bacterium]|nr:N-acetyl-gamma-glutamyl-phosphate reductase [Bacteroidota bacterium]